MPSASSRSRAEAGAVRRARALTTAALAAAASLGAACAGAQNLAPESYDLFGALELEGTGFARDPQFSAQNRDNVSVAGQLSFLSEWRDGDVALRITTFGRLDAQDDERTHWDVREAKLGVIEGDWSFTFGADRVFWGKTEVVHLVDIVNQDDRVESIDNEERLGQPMVRVGRLTEIGEFSLFFLPYFRERTFPGASGRLRTNPPVDDGRPLYDTSAEEWTPSFAARYSGVLGAVDLGVSAFHGLGREPALFLDGGELRPFYERITQGGVDVQYTSGATLWKGEGIFRLGQKNLSFEEEDYVALTGGFEHTLFGVYDTSKDLGLIAEYAVDSRGEDSLGFYYNDVFAGARLALNDEADTSILLLGSLNAESGATGLRLEAERRIADAWTLGVEGQAFMGLSEREARGSVADDSFIRATLTYRFGLR